MKKFLNTLSIVVLAVAVSGVQATETVRVIEFHTAKVGKVVHWMPEKVSVSPGEKVKFVLKHEMEGGFNFHGFTIRELDIVKQVDRNKTLEFEKKIPETLKAGEYKVSCHFHPKHMAAAMMVVSGQAEKGAEHSKADAAGMHSSTADHQDHSGHAVATAPAKKSVPAKSDKK